MDAAGAAYDWWYSLAQAQAVGQAYSVSLAQSGNWWEQLAQTEYSWWDMGSDAASFAMEH